jgi:ABC-2 type transport system ATP-binding protein
VTNNTSAGADSKAPPAVAIRDIRKRYGSVQALDGVSFEVAQGEFFGFLGPNGAGKTTTINALMGLAKLDGGEVSLFGYDTVREWRQARRQVGLAPQEYNFDRYLSIRDMLIYQAGYFGLRPREVGERADALLERLSLASKAKEPYTRLSGGMKRRLTLARALIHSPRLLVLDEPTAGVDVELRIELWELLRELNRDGITILLTTHYLDEAESLCRRIGIIDAGKLKALEPTPRLLELAGAVVLNITLDRPIRGIPPELADLRVTHTPGSRLVAFEGVAASGLSRILFVLENMGFTIEDVCFTRPSLQEVFLKLTHRGNAA